MKTITQTDDVRDAAERLAKANAESEESILRIYWFPAEDEIRLVEVDELTTRSTNGTMQPYYFGPAGDIPFPSGIALVHPGDEGRLVPPASWGSWTAGIVLFERAPTL